MNAKATPRNTKTFRSMDERLEALGEALPESERKLAELLTAQQILLATHSATELADLAGSSKAAVTRFIQRVGYRNFGEARREAREAQRWGAPAFQAPAELSAASEEVFGAHLRRDLENITQTFEHLVPGVVQPVVEALVRARRVAVVGYRNSYALAHYFSRQLVLLKDHVRLLPQAGQTLGEDLGSFTPQDMLILLAFRRRVPIVAQIARHAVRQKIPLLVLTDAAAKTSELAATWRIACETRGAGPFDSYAAPMSVLNLFVSTLAARPEISANARLRQAERLHDSLDEL